MKAKLALLGSFLLAVLAALGIFRKSIIDRERDRRRLDEYDRYKEVTNATRDYRNDPRSLSDRMRNGDF
jgi:hypothetical protein